MFGLFSSAPRRTAGIAVPIKEHPDFMQIANMSASALPVKETETAFQRDYGQHRIVTETAARLT